MGIRNCTMTQPYYRPCFPDNMTRQEKEAIDALSKAFRQMKRKQRELEENNKWLKALRENEETYNLQGDL